MVISWPSTRICPSSVFKNPLIILSVVVFPQPDAPRRHNSSPFGRESDKSFTTSFSPKLLLMFFSSKYTFLFPFPCNNYRKQHIY